MISLEEAKAMMTEDSINKLKEIVVVKPTINLEKKVNNDILMQALCRAVTEGIIHPESIDERLMKLLNSATNTLSAVKVGHILTSVRKYQPNMCCVITIMSGDMEETLNEWVYTGPDVSFNNIFEYVVETFNITPTMVRNKMTETLKPTIVNNIAQLIAKYAVTEDKSELTISINTISRLVNMTNNLIFAEFTER